MPTLRELHDNPAAMARFMGWPFEDDEVIEYGTDGNWPYTYRMRTARKRTAAEATADRYADWRRLSAPPPRRRQTWAEFVRECARKSFGIRARSAAEVQRICAERFPEMFQQCT